MTPAELDIMLNGAFVSQRRDGTQYASWRLPPAWCGDTLVRRTGRLTEADLARPASEVLADHNRRLSEASAA